ncbi:unnamed protein product [Oikopleura dioica]|uniref:mitogen-activated protein kinase kinase n=1 Tax=Oikopleura dioica TaxID=34765 RepID=E4XDB4_OIKDI|nr:unnamed protein product [Oikopleura dioica]
MSRKKPINLTLPGPIRRPPSIIIDSIQKNLDTDDHEKKKREEREQQEKRLRSQLTMQSKLGKYGEFNDSMFELDRELGAGNGGSVERVVHKETGTIMARKLIHLDTNEEVFKKILLELNILKDCNHKRVVAFYGSYQYQRSQIRICMEYMDGGSLDKVIFSFLNSCGESDQLVLHLNFAKNILTVTARWSLFTKIDNSFLSFPCK